MAVYAVGDIQGCYEPLRRLLDKIAFEPARDRLWCVGDLVNRGPDSLSVLRFLMSLDNACICVLGNHDLHLLGQAAGDVPYARDTLEDVLRAPDCGELMDWLRYRPMLHHDEKLKWCMVHGGLHPQWTLETAKERAARVEEMLRGKYWQEFCRKLHHREFPVSEPKGDEYKQCLFSTAVLARARYCTPAGEFNWEVRAGGPASNEEKPWFSHSNSAWREQARIVYGHWAALGLTTSEEHVLGLDSGCVWGGQLTAARLDSKSVEITQVPCKACQRFKA